MANKRAKRTVDGNGHALGQDVAIGTHKTGHLAELVDLEIVRGNTCSRLSVNDLETKVVGLGDGENRRGTRVVLVDCRSEGWGCCRQGSSSLFTHRIRIEFSERHG